MTGVTEERDLLVFGFVCHGRIPEIPSPAVLIIRIAPAMFTEFHAEPPTLGTDELDLRGCGFE